MIDDQDLELLRQNQLFQSFSEQDLNLAITLFSLRKLAKGEVVCERGEPGNEFFIVAAGELEVQSADDPPRTLRRLGRGDSFGEISLLTSGARSATVVAFRQTRLLVLQRDDFEGVLLRNSNALEAISRALCHRLASNARRHKVVTSLMVVGVTGPKQLRGKSLVAAGLSHLLESLSGRRTLRVSFDTATTSRDGLTIEQVTDKGADQVLKHVRHRTRGPAELVLKDSPELSAIAFRDAVAALNERLASEFGILVLDLGPRSQDGRELCDTLVRIEEQVEPGGAESHGREFPVLNLYNSKSRAIAISHCRPFVIPRDPELSGLAPDGIGEFLLANPGTAAGPSLLRLTRSILGQCVGLALGGGAAFGLSHIGVLRTLSDEGIPCDLVAGTSMGSVVGLGWAAGATPTDLEEFALRLGTRRTMLRAALDVTLTRPGILGGDRVVEILSPILRGVEDFTQLVHPCRAVATDIESGDRISIQEGSLTAAFRASMSVPLVWAPLRHLGRVLVDGAMSDPVPAEVVYEMGADVCISINVIPRPRKGRQTAITRLSRQLNRLNPLAYFGDAEMPNTFDIVMNSIQTLHHELGKFRSMSADVRIQPDLSEFTWTDFDRADELIERGADATIEALPAIRRVLDEKIDAHGGARD